MAVVWYSTCNFTSSLVQPGEVDTHSGLQVALSRNLWDITLQPKYVLVLSKLIRKRKSK